MGMGMGLLRNRPLRVMDRRERAAGSAAAFGLDFRNPVPMVYGFNLVVAGDHLELELLDEEGAVATAARLPRPEIEDLT